MKKLGYIIFGIIFHVCRLFPINKNKVFLYDGHFSSIQGNLLIIGEAVKKEKMCKTVYYSKWSKANQNIIRKIVRAFFVLPFHFATSKVVFMNDNFIPMAYCNFSKECFVVQLWHGVGAFKKFGLSSENSETVISGVRNANKKLTHLFVSSKKVVDFYAEAFGIDKSKIYATGIPVTDLYFEEKSAECAKERFYNKYPELREKKLLLVAPTFRNDSSINVIEQYPFDEMSEKLGANWKILLRQHPKYACDISKYDDYVTDVTNYDDITDLYFVSDSMITDYSSTVVEYVLLNKPIIMYAFDLDKYDRGFYRDYEKYSPGPVARNREELISLMEHFENTSDMGSSFKNMQYDYFDNKSTERIINVLKKTGKL